jgi:hypothetical protein
MTRVQIVFSVRMNPHDHGNATMLADGAKARLDFAPSAPGFEAGAPELRPPVADDVLGRSARAVDRVPQERTNGFACRSRSEERDAHTAPRTVIEYHRHPPAERPALGQGERQPGRPEAAGHEKGSGLF